MSARVDKQVPKGGQQKPQARKPQARKPQPPARRVRLTVKTRPTVERERVGLTPEQLAGRTGISAGTLRRTEQDGTPFWFRAQRLAAAINKVAAAQGLAQTAKTEYYINPRRAALAAMAQGERVSAKE